MLHLPEALLPWTSGPSWTTISYPRRQGWDLEPQMLDNSCKLITDNTTFQQRLLRAFSCLQQKVLRGASNCTCSMIHLVCLKTSFLGSMPTTARQWVHSDSFPSHWQLCLIVFPCSHLLLASYSQTADLLWSSPPPSFVLTQHLPAAWDAGSQAGILSITVE